MSPNSRTLADYPVCLTSAGFDPSSHEEADEVCVPNISLRERKRRERAAVWLFIFSLIVLGVLLANDVTPLWRLPLFFLFSAAATSYFQSLDKT